VRKRLIGVTALACAAWAAQAQGTPQFAAVSVKECGANERSSPMVSSPATLSLGCYSLTRLISDAYWLFEHGRVEQQRLGVMFRMEGLPAWAQGARVSIDAKTEGPMSGAMMRGPIMQRLLEERFGLRVHREMREGPVYVMTAPMGAEKLKTSTEESCDTIDPSDSQVKYLRPAGSKPWCMEGDPRRKESKFEWDVRGMSLDALARRIYPGQPVVDRTGLTGLYDIHLTWDADPPPGEHAGGPSEPRDLSIFRAIREQLGLDIRPGRGMSEHYIVDHIEHPPAN